MPQKSYKPSFKLQQKGLTCLLLIQILDVKCGKSVKTSSFQHRIYLIITTVNNHCLLSQLFCFILVTSAESSQANASLLLETEEVRRGITALNHKVSRCPFMCLIPAVLFPLSFLNVRSNETSQPVLGLFCKIQG